MSSYIEALEKQNEELRVKLALSQLSEDNMKPHVKKLEEHSQMLQFIREHFSEIAMNSDTATKKASLTIVLEFDSIDKNFDQHIYMKLRDYIQGY